MTQIQHLFRGKPSPLQNHPDLTSAINKSETEELNVLHDHIEGDEVSNKIHHGGLQRVIHYYPLEHYQYWQTLYPETPFLPGSIGENISAFGLLEKNVCIGDIYQIGEVLCTVTEPRKPCATINHKYEINSFARLIQATARTGWFYKVLVTGKMRVNDQVLLRERPYPKLTLESCILALLVNPDRTHLDLMANNEVLSENWRRPAREFLKTGQLPDDRKRLGEI